MKRISDSEWKVMEVAWESSPVTAQDVAETLGQQENWKPQTVKTLLGRLVKKGALHYETQGNRYLYTPALSRKEAVAAETGSFLDRISRGSLAPMLHHFVESDRPLGDEEISALRELLQRNTNKSDGGKR
ncbi:MAG: BlaI/MecI/CopY family transcriptional regulator [Verrucomicrobiota bacterium]